MNGEDR
ncbi:hypothetical protein YPPY05_1458, partial [Yersinia pestis PY-05]